MPQARRFGVFVLIVILVMSLAATVYAAESVPGSVLSATKSVVRIEADYSDGYSLGSGFVIESGRRTLVVTNHHVVEDKPLRVFILLGDDQILSASILAVSPQRDLAVLELGYPISLPALKLSNTGAKRGEAVYAVGFPGAADYFSDKLAQTGEEATITDGIISAVRQLSPDSNSSPVTILQTTAEINSGNSGGPLFNKKGVVVGVNTWGVVESQGVFGAVSSAELIAFLQENGIQISGFGGAGSTVTVALGAAAGLILALAVLLLVRRKRDKSEPEFHTPVPVAAPAAVPAGRPAPSIPLSSAGTAGKPPVESASFRGRGEPVPVKRRRHPVLAVLLLALVLGGAYLGSWYMASAAARDGDFPAARRWSVLPFPDGKLRRYTAAGEMLESGEYLAAAEGFSSLYGYRDAAWYYNEARYRYAAQQADADNYDVAIGEFRALASVDFRDAAEKIPETQFRKAIYLMEVKDDAAPAIGLLSELKNEGYPGVTDYIEDRKDFLYSKAISFYRVGNYPKARAIFEWITPYKETETYLMLIKFHEGHFPEISTLLRNVGFEDVNKILMSSRYYFESFMVGYWYDDNRAAVLYFDSSGTWKRDNLPGYSKKYYYIDNGIKYVYNKQDKSDAVADVRFTIIDRNRIKVYCYINGKTYTLHR